MSNEEIVKEIDEATRFMTEAKVKTNVALNLARNAVMKESKADEEAYNKGLEDGRNEVWEWLKKFGKMRANEAKRLYGYNGELWEIFDNFTPQEVLLKLEEYEKEQNEIKAGYVYEIMGKFCAVVQVDEFNNEYHIIWCDGGTDRIPFETPIGFKKTGKHIDIQSILKQIGSDADELS